MENNFAEYAVYILIGVNAIISMMAFSNYKIFEGYKFRVGDILGGKEFYRLVSSAFLHGSFGHLFVNMLTLYFFGPGAIYLYGLGNFFLIYSASLIFGNLLALYIHRRHDDYSAVGASGAISGVMMAVVVIVPNLELRLFFMIPMPGWVFGALYIVGSIYGIKTQMGNIGHEAHLGGAIGGMALGLAFMPEYILANLWVVLLFFIPIVVFLILIVKNPGFMLVKGLFKQKSQKFVKNLKKETSVQKINLQINVEKRLEEKRKDEIILNQLLEKINAHGYEGLTPEEILELERLSKNI